MAVGQSMRVIEIDGFGEPEVLKPVWRSRPIPGPGEVLIEVAAAGINRPDLMQRRGLYPPPRGASDIPGLEIAGTIVEIGEGVDAQRLGNKVCALVSGGGYAELCIAAEALCLPIPEGLSELEAAALPETCFTVWTNLFELGRLRPGERLLVHGGAGGIGSTAIQIATALGVEVFATAGTNEKCSLCEALGAKAINYQTHDFVVAVLTLTGSRGVNVVLDMIGGDYLQRNLSCLTIGGRLVLIACQHGPKTEINLLPFMTKRLTLTGSTLRPRSVAEKAAIAKQVQDRVWPLVTEGRLKPLIHQTFPLEAAAEAHRLMESGSHHGKLVLDLSGR